jgi:hypothetical protein
MCGRIARTVSAHARAVSFSAGGRNFFLPPFPIPHGGEGAKASSFRAIGEQNRCLFIDDLPLSLLVRMDKEEVEGKLLR